MMADLHVHSTYSGDCDLKVEAILEKCKSLSIRVVSIVDHNSLEGTMRALAIKQDDVIVLPGIEITSNGGHVIAYNIEEIIPRGKSVEETIDLIHDHGGIAAAPHPYRLWSGLGRKEIIGKKFDVIETINARSSSRSNLKAKKLLEIVNCGEIGGSDAHSLSHIGKGYTIFPDHCENADDLVKEILNKRTKAGGVSRKFSDSLSYGAKCISEWLARGMKRL
ncbi:MAG: PHP-associated domain-containing protein [Methanomassiliicoccales archaeon]|jgi:predicted metal-dependent phosphoesterase TrpH|nr:PHP-associated domain-containing protein [Methanomassiliicoccales archaeon]